MGTHPGSNTLVMRRLPEGTELDREGGGSESGLKGDTQEPLRS